tara:strand:- start:219 stop:344 length:126 start_codon:yes stop_codon:yes gene_type:complete
MRAALMALMLMIGSQVGAGCGSLCIHSWGVLKSLREPLNQF